MSPYRGLLDQAAVLAARGNERALHAARLYQRARLAPAGSAERRTLKRAALRNVQKALREEQQA